MDQAEKGTRVVSNKLYRLLQLLLLASLLLSTVTLAIATVAMVQSDYDVLLNIIPSTIVVYLKN